jgi:hypothetical protein
VPGLFQWGGDTAIYSTVAIPPTGQLVISGSGPRELNGSSGGGRIVNDGRIVWLAAETLGGPGVLRLGSRATVTNNGAFNAVTDVVLSSDCCLNQGLFENGPGASFTKWAPGESRFDGVTLANAGTLDVKGGALTLAVAPHQFAPGTRLTGGGAVRVADLATLVLRTDPRLEAGATLELAKGGTLTGAGGRPGAARSAGRAGRCARFT